MIQIRIEGKPVSWTAPIVGRFGTYSKHAAQKKVIQNIIASQYNGPLHKTAITVFFAFAFIPPRSLSNKKRKAMIEGLIPHTKRPDCTNLTKLLEDCATGIIWLDDNQIIESRTRKFYDETEYSLMYVIVKN